MKAQFSLSIESLTTWLAISYSSFMRWKRRIFANEMPVKKPGPKKTVPFDLTVLKRGIRQLKHCRKRSLGAGQLIKKYQDCISRRHLAKLIGKARQQANNKTECRISWHHPNLVWSIDGCEIKPVKSGVRLHVQNLQDLCSTYKFMPLTTLCEPDGKNVSAYLLDRFEKYGTPLFLKRDNARNFNCRSVDRLLEKQMVIPLNSPCYYPSYNGGIEHAQGELKTYLKNRKAESVQDIILQVKMGTHELNHKIRRVLRGGSACRVYFNRYRPVYGKRKRRQIFDWIKKLAFEISSKAGKDEISSGAWRYACQKWMEENGVITLEKRRKVLPDFSLVFDQN